MILYHGSNVEVKIPKIYFTEKGRDFGPAFYLTPIKEQTERMAKRKCKQLKNGTPIVSVFVWDEDVSELNYRIFREADLDWLEMIIACRKDPRFMHSFDIVEGKIADDSVGETVLFVLSEIMRKEDALEKIKFQKINSQIAFCSELALEGLQFIESYKVK